METMIQSHAMSQSNLGTLQEGNPADHDAVVLIPPTRPSVDEGSAGLETQQVNTVNARRLTPSQSPADSADPGGSSVPYYFHSSGVQDASLTPCGPSLPGVTSSHNDNADTEASVLAPQMVRASHPTILRDADFLWRR